MLKIQQIGLLKIKSYYIQLKVFGVLVVMQRTTLRLKEFCLVSKEDIKILEKKWPGPTTFLLERGSDKYKELSYLNRHAVRVSAHKPIVDLLGLFGSEIVSTSANISGGNEIKNKDDIVSFFNYEDVAIFDGNLGNLKKPTRIFDLKLKKNIR